MIRRLSRSLLLPAALVVATSGQASADLTSVGSFNLITSGNLSGDSSDVQGRVLVGGTLGVNQFTFGGQLGNIAGGTSGTNGVFNILGSGVTAPNNNSLPNVYYATNSSGGTVSNASTNASLVSGYTHNLGGYLTGLSTAYADLASNSTTTVSGSTVTFAATPTTIGGKSVAVFSVNQSVFTNQNESFTLSGGSSSTTYIINVTGGTAGNDALTFAGGLGLSNIINQNNSANILFNFENATALNGLPNLGASILAPDATLNTSNSLTGGVYVQAVQDTGEIDLSRANGTLVSGFTGFAPSIVPEPSSVVMVTIGGALAVGFGVHRRRRSASRAVTPA